MNQSLPIIGDVVGQRGNAYVECIETGKRQGRINIAGAVPIRHYFFLGGTDTPLARTAEGRLQKRLPQLNTQEYRIVVRGTGADLARRGLVQHRIVGHGADVPGEVPPVLQNIQSTAQSNIRGNINFKVVYLIGQGRPHIFVQAQLAALIGYAIHNGLELSCRVAAQGVANQVLGKWIHLHIPVGIGGQGTHAGIPITGLDDHVRSEGQAVGEFDNGEAITVGASGNCGFIKYRQGLIGEVNTHPIRLHDSQVPPGQLALAGYTTRYFHGHPYFIAGKAPGVGGISGAARAEIINRILVSSEVIGLAGRALNGILAAATSGNEQKN